MEVPGLPKHSLCSYRSCTVSSSCWAAPSQPSVGVEKNNQIHTWKSRASGINASVRTALNPSSLGHPLAGATAGQRVASLPPPPKCQVMGGSEGDGLNLAWGLRVLVVSVFPCIKAGRALACRRGLAGISGPWVHLGLPCTWALYSEAHSDVPGAKLVGVLCHL